MNESYWMGVLSVPALILAAAALWLAAKAIGKVGERLLVGGIQRLGRGATEGQRVGTASVIYSAKHSIMIGAGNLGLVFVVGMDAERMRTASARLNPPVSLRDLTRSKTDDSLDVEG